MLTALATYGSSYRRADTGQSAEQTEIARKEERKKALESLVDSMTDRSGREGQWLLTFGSNVALTGDRRVPTSGTMDDGREASGYWNALPISLKTGFAVQHLPTGWCPGVHIGLTLLDLAQYATLNATEESDSNDNAVDAPQPEPMTAVRLGGELGALFGEPSFPIILAGHVGYIPRVNWENADPRSEVTFGVSAGVFVPFWDVNP